MSRILLGAALLALILSPRTAGAESVDDGLAAYHRSDFDSAMRILTPHAQSGNSTAQAVVGAMYHNGTGVSRDYAEAMQWYLKAAMLGEMHALYNIGILYEDGLGVAQDLVPAYKFYALSLNRGFTGAGQKLDVIRNRMSKWQFAEACSALAAIFEEGNSFGLYSPDSAEALKWYREAARTLPKQLAEGGEARAESKKKIDALQLRVQELESELKDASQGRSASDSGLAGAAERVRALDSELAQATARASEFESRSRAANGRFTAVTTLFAACVLFSPLIFKAKVGGVALGSRLLGPPAAAPAAKSAQLVFRSDGLEAGASPVRVQKRTFVLTNPGERSLDIAVTSDKPWLFVEPAKIVIEPGGEEVFIVSVTRALINGNSAQGAIEVRGQGNDFHRDIRVEV